jgi:hypothetical protein
LWYVALMVYLHRPYPELTGMVDAASYVGAILMAFWFKRWDWANPVGDNLPIRGYVLSAVAAFGFATLASLVSRASWRLKRAKPGADVSLKQID